MPNVGPYTFGFLSQVTGISFPSGIGLIGIFSAVNTLVPGSSVTVNATSPSDVNLPIDPLPLIDSLTPTKSYGATNELVYSGASKISILPANPVQFVQNFLVVKLLGPDVTITLDMEATGSIEYIAVLAGYFTSLPFNSIVNIGANEVTVGEIDFTGGTFNLSLPNLYTGSSVKGFGYDLDSSVGLNTVEFIREGKVVLVS